MCYAHLFILNKGHPKIIYKMAIFHQHVRTFKICNISFVGNYTRNITKLLFAAMTLVQRHLYDVVTDSHPKTTVQLFSFCGLRELTQQILTVKCVQCMVKSVVLDRQYLLLCEKFACRSENVDRKWSGWHVVAVKSPESNQIWPTYVSAISQLVSNYSSWNCAQTKHKDSPMPTKFKDVTDHTDFCRHVHHWVQSADSGAVS